MIFNLKLEKVLSLKMLHNLLSWFHHNVECVKILHFWNYYRQSISIYRSVKSTACIRLHNNYFFRRKSPALSYYYRKYVYCGIKVILKTLSLERTIQGSINFDDGFNKLEKNSVNNILAMRINVAFEFNSPFQLSTIKLSCFLGHLQILSKFLIKVASYLAVQIRVKRNREGKYLDGKMRKEKRNFEKWRDINYAERR